MADGMIKPRLHYVEFHLVEHCNLGCRGCGHFSPLAPESFADVESVSRDLRQLAVHFSGIRRIALMGGEPLLHPAPEAFVDATAAVFPSAEIIIITNGTRIKAMPPRFWEACRKAGVVINLSLYPAMADGLAGVERICAENGVKLKVDKANSFMAGMNPKGDSDPAKAMEYCRSYFYCPFLKDGRLHVCALPATTKYFNDKFGKRIATDAGIDIFDPGLDGETILKLLNTPVETCKFCACTYKHYPWENLRTHTPDHYEVAE